MQRSRWLAALAGTSRETATKILGEFAGQGLVGLGRGWINISTESNFGRLSGG
jgi:CRP-like cAMP-binding protein